MITALAVPASADTEAERNAAKGCKQQRSEMGVVVFKQTYGTNRNRSNALGKCVSKQVSAEKVAKANAAKTCKAERDADPAAFDAKYKNLGRCVSTLAKQQVDANNEAKVETVKTCKAERAADPGAFKEKYGTNKNKANAFGKCVAKVASAR